MADVGVLSSIGKEVDGDNLVRLLRYLLQNLSAENMTADPFNLTTEERACGSFDGRTLYRKILPFEITEDTVQNRIEHHVSGQRMLWLDTVLVQTAAGVFQNITHRCEIGGDDILLPNETYDAGSRVYAIIYYVKGGNGR